MRKHMFSAAAWVARLGLASGLVAALAPLSGG